MAVRLNPGRWPGLPVADWNKALALAERYGSIAGWADVCWHLDGAKLRPVEIEPGQHVWGDKVSVRPMGSSGEYRLVWKFELYRSLKMAEQDARRNAETRASESA